MFLQEQGVHSACKAEVPSVSKGGQWFKDSMRLQQPTWIDNEREIDLQAINKYKARVFTTATTGYL